MPLRAVVSHSLRGDSDRASGRAPSSPDSRGALVQQRQVGEEVRRAQPTERSLVLAANSTRAATALLVLPRTSPKNATN